MEHAKTLRGVTVAGALAALALLGAGCAGSTTVAASYPAGTAVVYDYPVTYVQTVPDLTYYPRTYYRGSYAYLVNGRWYYQTNGRWVVFREEPRELYRYRVYDYDRLEAPRRVRGAEYGTVPQSRPRYYERGQPVPQYRDQHRDQYRERYYEAPPPARTPQSAPRQQRTRQPATTPRPTPTPPKAPAPSRHYQRR